MFYTKTIEIWESHEKEIAGGVTVNKELVKVSEMKADVQPYTRASAYYDYGLDIDVSHAIFTPVHKFTPGVSVIKYNGELLDVKETMEWDNHTEVLAQRRR